ncbi:MAG: hypothetical protein IPI09_16450 [Burkholderiales bacterium]|uniref:hypothetical protein n=1 Tax=Candidatus Aalborgicola defluviihabitans TaxID=3386187 RepID=UPI001EB9760F|nr:hypothetical protein [Burkholderiales bacterium]MBK7282223.1 hypothetical protein [Burkholderiales bacterium]
MKSQPTKPAAPPTKPAAPPTTPEQDRYMPGDPIPVPQAVEANSESTWALFSDVPRLPEPDFLETVPMSLTEPDFSETVPMSLAEELLIRMPPTPRKPSGS